MATSAILAGIDASEWAGDVLFSRNGTTVSAPALGSMHDGGHYPDIMALLTGWATQQTLTAQIAADWAGAGLTGTPTATIGADGLFKVSVSGAIGTLDLTVGVTDPWGWGGALSSVTEGALEVLRATRPWTRGRFAGTTQSLFSVDDGVGLGQFPNDNAYAHSLPTWCSGPTTPDLDEVTECIEKWDNDATDATDKRFRWGIDSEGRVFTSWPTALGAAFVPTWVSTTFRNAIGFTGSETQSNALGVRMLVATYPPLGLLLVRSGLRIVDHSRDHAGAAFDLMSGQVAGRSHATWREVMVTADLQGGVGLVEANAGYQDEEQQLLSRVSHLLYPGARATLVPRWDDPRIGRSIAAQISRGDTPVVESAQLTSLVGGVTGRRRCQVSTDHPRSMTLGFAPGGPRTRTSASWRLRLLDG